jgi:hypothetical protein
MLGLAAAQMVQIIPIVRRPPGGLGSAILGGEGRRISTAEILFA